MLVVTHGGSEYSVDDCRHWMNHAGFESIDVHWLESNDVLVVGHKGA